MGRLAILIYGLVSYAIFFASFLYAIGFTGNFAVPKGIDAGRAGATSTAIVVDLLLLSAFAIQHSVMARPAYKARWTRIVPVHAERPTFVLLASLLLSLMYWQWRPLPSSVWSVSNSALGDLLWGLFAVGWTTVLLSTFMIGHFALFGVWQAWLGFQGKAIPSGEFITPGLYKTVRHPIMLGFIVGFWATPRMSQGHLLFAAVTTAYILIAIQIEEHDLVEYFGEKYLQYKKTTPMLLPTPKRK